MTVLFYDLASLVLTCEPQLFKRPRQLLKMTSLLWQRLLRVHPTPFPPLPGHTVRPHFPGSLAVRHLGAAM